MSNLELEAESARSMAYDPENIHPADKTASLLATQRKLTVGQCDYRSGDSTSDSGLLPGEDCKPHSPLRGVLSSERGELISNKIEQNLQPTVTTRDDFYDPLQGMVDRYSLQNSTEQNDKLTL